MTSPRPQVSNATARRLFQLVEPIAVVTYLAPEPTEAVMALGAGTMWDAYFAPGPRAGPSTPQCGRCPCPCLPSRTITTMIGSGWAKRHLRIRAHSATGQVAGAATY